ncbi:hypothetical protein JRO89_XS12G0222100 [Xanthoceras sorbifolium]|uniref:GDSL esterase/lipase n=1 Tax=Xanthoceras sorbifolium TaxID=99658 RepID=A0ABQ8HDJ2_9ROSI|nr:hypothetical protein JRO89_XS12G0222100 [Xanthoceras sorbifolium]
MQTKKVYCQPSDQPLAPALYVFGDSLFDSGNNNILPTIAKANYSPYGFNFVTKGSGRFTNGKTVPDFIAEFLGLPYSPPYLSLRNSFSPTGLNYASGSCGILPETGVSLRLYDLGARKVVVFDLGPIGCIPSITRKQKHNGKCVENVNQIISFFNKKLPGMLRHLKSSLKGSNFVLGHVNGLGYDAVINPSKYGLMDSSNPCCKALFNGTSGCFPFSKPCTNPDQHYFWDGFHLTQTMYSIVASRCINDTSVCMPFNLKHLIQM